MALKAYYEDPYTKLYLGDCREIIPQLPDVGDVPGKFCDITFSDPPYGIEYLSTHYKHGNPFGKIEEDDMPYPVDVLELCLAGSTSAVFFMGGWQTLLDYPAMPRPQNCIVWAKNNWGTGNLQHGYGPRWEAIFFWFLEQHMFQNGRPNDVVFSDRVSPDKRVHPTEKPTGLMSQILQHNVGDVVFDPYCGSGGTLVAAKELGRKGIGCEITERYVEAAAKKIEQEVFPDLHEVVECEQEGFDFSETD